MGRFFSFLLIILLIIFLFATGLFVAVAIGSVAIVPLTWLWGLMTGQSYDRVCDNSEIVYRLNQLGKWTIYIGIALLIFSIFFLLLF